MNAVDVTTPRPRGLPVPQLPGAAPRQVPQAGGIMNRLRRATHPHHMAVERSPVLACLMAPALTLEAYGLALAKLYGFHLAAERRLDGLLAAAPDAAGLALTPRADLLASDLRWLGIAPDALAVAPGLDALHTWRMAAGALYVLEGSRLGGGRVIARRLQDSLDLTAERGAAFFAADSADDCRNDWLAFSRRLEALATDRCGHTEDDDGATAIVDGAVVAFQALSDWVAGAEPLDREAGPRQGAGTVAGGNPWPTR